MRYRKRDNMIEKLQALLEIEEGLLLSTDEQINVVTRNYLNLMNKMPKGEFYQAVTLNTDGDFKMREGYNGYFVQVVKLLDSSRQNLEIQKQQCMARIRSYEEKLNQLMRERNSLEQIPQVTNSVPTTSPMFMGQSANMPVSGIHVDQKENNTDKGMGRIR